MVSPYSQVVAVLGRHISRLNAESVLQNALRRRGLTPTSLSPTDVPGLVADLERGIALFGGADAKRLRGELHSLDLPAAPPEPRDVPIRTEHDVLLARQAAVSFCEALGSRSFLVQRVATVVAELARNIALYTPGGEIALGLPGGVAARLIGVVATDRGSGIRNLDDIMAGRYRSKTGLGLGLRGTKRLSSRFAIDTGPHGTRVALEISI